MSTGEIIAMFLGACWGVLAVCVCVHMARRGQ